MERLALLALVLLPTPLIAHGGQYMGPPADAGGAVSAPTTVTSAPTASGGASSSAAATGAASAPTSAGPAATGSRSRTVRGSSSRATRTTVAPRPAFDGWEYWWETNRDRFLMLRQHLFHVARPAGSPGALTARGPKTVVAQRPSPALVDDRIVPTLIGLTHTADERDILDSTVLALSRSVSPAKARQVMEANVALLDHHELSVQSAAALSLGVLGSADARKLLTSLLRDDSAGRAATGGGPVHWLVRAFAALSLGMVGDAPSVHVLMDTALRLPRSEPDLQVCTVAALGTLGRDHPLAHFVQEFLLERLEDPAIDPRVKSYVATSLGKVGDDQAVARLTELLHARGTANAVRQSAAIALGLLVSMDDEETVDGLVDYVARGKDQQTRHFALIALGQVGARDVDGAPPARHRALVRVLEREISGRGASRSHRSWAALAGALYGRTHSDAVRGDLVRAVRDAFDGERDPSFRGAFAIALGLLDDGASASALLTSFRETEQADYRGYASVALGMLGHTAASGELLALCRDKAVPPTFRLKTATGLGLMGDRHVVPVLIESMRSAHTLAVLSGVARALGLIGDETAVEPLLELVADERAGAFPRAFACVALGLLGATSDLPFNEALRANINYYEMVPSMAEVISIL